MSVVAVIKDGDNVYIGCDSQASRCEHKFILTNKNNYKIFRPIKEKDVIIGVYGDLRNRDILFCIDEYIDELTKIENKVDCRYMIKNVIPKIFKTLENEHKITNTKNDSIIIFNYKNQIYYINDDGSILEIDDYFAIGSGAKFSIGYLSECDKINPKEALIKSIRSACKNDLDVNYPIIIMNNQNDNIEIIEK